MLTTQEVRWFFKGLLPEPVSQWFYRTNLEPTEYFPREDQYLRLPGNQTLGVKVREGRIEIKQRLQDFGVIPLQSRVSGRIEQWRKWSFLLSETEPPLALLIESADWIGVTKSRLLRKYEVTKSEAAVAIPIDRLVARGCAVELGEIQTGGERWWSLCFEAFGGEPTLQDNLMQVAAHVLQGEGMPRLEAGDSQSYPMWLSRLTG